MYLFGMRKSANWEDGFMEEIREATRAQTKVHEYEKKLVQPLETDQEKVPEQTYTYRSLRECVRSESTLEQYVYRPKNNPGLLWKLRVLLTRISKAQAL